MELKDSVVLFPTVGTGHLIPMVELAKLFDAHGFSVTVVVVDPPFDTSSNIDPFFLRASSANPSILFHRLPKIASSTDTTHYHFDTLRQAGAQLLDFLKSRKPAPNNVRALVLDMFCFPGLDVAEELGVPAYFFFPSGAIALAAFLALPALQSSLGGGSFRDSFGGGAKVDLPGLPPVSVVDLPDDVPDRTDTNRELLSNLEHLWRADGFIVNTFEWLEKRAVKALADGNCVPGRRNPPAYCVGPLNNGEADKRGGGGGGIGRHECLEWLDAQPGKSVVFLCFGSNGFLPVEQLKEIAVGLERSGQRFLWVARSRHVIEKEAVEAFLREGFLERTRRRGMVARSWVPQDLVLTHGSVGAFVSHCGWNSSLEAVCAGLPVIAWPRGAEQRMNKVLLVEEAKVAVAVEGYEKGVVSAEEVERKVRWLMESDEGKVIRDRAAEAKEAAAAARKEGGSSTLAWSEVLKLLRKE